MTANYSDQVSELTDAELEDELEAAIEIKDEAEEQGDLIRYVNQNQYVKALKREKEARDILTDYLCEAES